MQLDPEDVRLLAILLALLPLGWRICKKFFREAESVGYRRWPVISAKIERVRTDLTEVQAGSKLETHAVVYSYVTPEGQFEGEFAALEPWSSHYTTVTPWNVMYPPGKLIQIHCNPKHPSISVAINPDPEGMPKAF